MSLIVGYNGIVRYKRNRFPKGTVGGRRVYGYSARGMRYGRRGGHWFGITGKSHTRSILGY